ncbi:hypothetical protein [Mannheimia granulomatis]|nr:hypothetical protein [Mannheimia granulomatis]
MSFDEHIKKRPIVWVFNSCLLVAIGMFSLMQYVNSEHNEALNKNIEYLKPFKDEYTELKQEHEEIKRENSILKDDNKLLKNKLENIQSELEKSNSLLKELTNQNQTINKEYKILENSYNQIKKSTQVIKSRPKTKNDLIEDQINKLESQKKICGIHWIEPLDGKEEYVDPCQEENQKIEQKIIELIKLIN